MFEFHKKLGYSGIFSVVSMYMVYAWAKACILFRCGRNEFTEIAEFSLRVIRNFTTLFDPAYQTYRNLKPTCTGSCGLHDLCYFAVIPFSSPSSFPITGYDYDQESRLTRYSNFYVLRARTQDQVYSAVQEKMDSEMTPLYPGIRLDDRVKTFYCFDQ